MTFKIGLVGLCTSHPEAWLPIIRQLAADGRVDVEVVAAWDSGETRPANFAEEFGRKNHLPAAVDCLENMVELVDGVIIHACNWDRHLEYVTRFAAAGKSILLDKPLAGNMAQLNRLAEMMKTGARICGGSSLRFAPELLALREQPEAERGALHTAYMALGVDDFNYAIHGYAAFCGLFGGGIRSVRYLGGNARKHLMLTWHTGQTAFFEFGPSAWLPFKMTVTSATGVFQLNLTRFYETFLEKNLPYLARQTEMPPLTIADLMVPELAALAARQSWQNHGQEVFLSDLRSDDPGYDGTQFATEYRRARLPDSVPAAK